jgi:hypothetical protein
MTGGVLAGPRVSGCGPEILQAGGGAGGGTATSSWCMADAGAGQSVKA